MNRLTRAFLLLAAFALLVSPSTSLGMPATSPTVVAFNRCNAREINDLSGQIRGFDKGAPNGKGALQERFGALDEILQQLNQERAILDSVCTSDDAKASLFAQIGAAAAWGLELEADVAYRLNLPGCPNGAKAIAAPMAAQAWLDLASLVNEAGGTPPKALAEVIPKVQARAEALELKLPAWSETSAYWRDQTAAAGKTAAEACGPTPTPMPTDTPPPQSSVPIPIATP